MAFREFTDAKGEVWKVWDVTPDQRIVLRRRTPVRGIAGRSDRTEPDSLVSSDVTPSREGGWLAFQSNEENRRLSPIPGEWENSTDVEMRGYLAKATQVKNRYKT